VPPGIRDWTKSAARVMWSQTCRASRLQTPTKSDASPPPPNSVPVSGTAAG
jgi:hypothetical protein